MAMMVLMPFIPFMQHRTFQQQHAVAGLAGTLAIARSPASAVCTSSVLVAACLLNRSQGLILNDGRIAMRKYQILDTTRRMCSAGLQCRMFMSVSECQAAMWQAATTRQQPCLLADSGIERI